MPRIDEVTLIREAANNQTPPTIETLLAHIGQTLQGIEAAVDHVGSVLSTILIELKSI